MKTLKVDAIRNGTVIDHIPGGQVLRVLNILKPRKNDVIMAGMNFPSQAMGQKDIIKIEGRELTADEVNSIALIAPRAKVNIIRDFKVVKKGTVEVPDAFEGLVRCPNPNCISNAEPIVSRFQVVKRDPVTLCCGYCERVYQTSEIEYL